MTDRLANAQERAIKIMEKVFIECYKEGFDDGYKEGQHCGEIDGVMNIQIDEVSYQRGLNDAWECTKKLYTMYTKGDITKIFNASFGSILKNSSAQECMAKIKECEEKECEEKEKSIKVGDIVTVVGDTVMIGEKPNEFIVTWVGNDEVTLITRNGFHARTARIKYLTKTGEHCDIEKCFKCKVF